MSDLPQATVGIIGGTGTYKLNGFDSTELSVDTPYGKVAVFHGTMEDTAVAFIPRHGLGHSRLPSEVNYRGIMYAMKLLGVKYVIAISACGSLREDYVPGQLALTDQFIDKTAGRISTFFGDGIVAHVSLGDPVCNNLRQVIADSAAEVHGDKVVVHPTATYICIDGPAFSTRPESLAYKSWGADIIGMTGMPEVRLAREAELAYAQIACITDYDAWRPHCESVDALSVMDVLKTNSHNAQALLPVIFRKLKELNPVSPAHTSLTLALVTDLATVPEATKERLAPILARTTAERVTK